MTAETCAYPTLRRAWGADDRVAWAFRAYDEFIATLPSEVQEHLVQKQDGESHHEAYVVVFGKTQVGKTTLILELMQVDPNVLIHVANILRGGQARAKSATATATEYRRSADNRWGICRDKQTGWQYFADDAGVEEALRKLRAEMEASELNADIPCVIEIPANYFDSKARARLSVRMLDLPGDNPHSDIEQQHVEAMARKYVPNADLILLVGKGDQLEFLQPGNLTLAGIKDWQLIPGRFRVVTTYSYKPETIRDIVRNASENSVEYYRKRLIEQSGTFKTLIPEAQKLERFYPLEFGESWHETQKNEPELFNKIDELIRQLKAKLFKDIEQSATPMGRLKAAVDVHITLKGIYENRLKNLEECVDVLGKERDALESKHHARKKFSDTIWEKNNATEKSIHRWLQSEIRCPVLENVEVGNPDETVSGFKSMVSTAKKSLQQAAIDQRPSGEFWRDIWTQKEVQKVLSDSLQTFLDKAFSEFLSHLETHILDDYYPSVSNEYSRDKNRFKDSLKDARSTAIQNVITLSNSARQAYCKVLFEQLEGEKYQQELLVQDVENLRRAWVYKENEWSKKLAEQAALHDECKREEENSKKFMHCFNEFYLRELKERRNKFILEKQPVKAFLQLLAAKQVCQERKIILARHLSKSTNH